MTPEAALHFRDHLRDARAEVLRNAEAYEAVVHVLERMGSYLSPDGKGLADYETELAKVAGKSALARQAPLANPDFHLCFKTLFTLVRQARNSAVHEGALARHLTTHALELALVLEDALMVTAERIGDYMVRGPVTAVAWHPLSFVRQSMLANSFSFLPVWIDSADDGRWMLVADAAVARFLRTAPSNRQRRKRLCMPLKEATQVKDGGVLLDVAQIAKATDPLRRHLAKISTHPILVTGAAERELLGIVTAFDLL